MAKGFQKIWPNLVALFSRHNFCRLGRHLNGRFDKNGIFVFGGDVDDDENDDLKKYKI